MQETAEQCSAAKQKKRNAYRAYFRAQYTDRKRQRMFCILCLFPFKHCIWQHRIRLAIAKRKHSLYFIRFSSDFHQNRSVICDGIEGSKHQGISTTAGLNSILNIKNAPPRTTVWSRSAVHDSAAQSALGGKSCALADKHKHPAALRKFAQAAAVRRLRFRQMPRHEVFRFRSNTWEQRQDFPPRSR